MKFLPHSFLSLLSFFTCVTVFSQAGHVFYKEDFGSGKLPSGWKSVDLFNKGCDWVVTDQPYPGSYGYQQQAPPIASVSRGFHLQYQAGYFVDEDQPAWIKRSEYPDAYVVSAPIDCSGKKTVVLSFQQKFRYTDISPEKGAGLYVGVSTDSLNWKDYNVLSGIKPSTDMFLPLTTELNISDVAANSPKVYLRFYWKGYYGWYWMVDDISLSEALDHDVAITRLVSHGEEANDFKKNDRFVLQVKNTGAAAITSDIPVRAWLDGKPLPSAVAKAPIAPGATALVSFPVVDLSRRPVHHVRFVTALPGDERPGNDSLSLTMNARETLLGAVTGVSAAKDGVTFSSGISKVKLLFYSNDVFRIWLAPDGNFTNPAGDDIVTDYAVKNPSVKITSTGGYYKVATPALVVRVYKNPMRFALYDKTNTKRIWEELEPLCFGAQTVQTMKRGSGEYFYGGGMQNGYFSHRGKEIRIEKGGGWDDGGRANPAPFYMSTAGYGAFRNTFDVGQYAFTDTLRFAHNENRFDCFYFYGPSLKKILDEYTATTGRPFLMPRWALGMGDANCYNRGAKGKTQYHGGTGTNGFTPDVVPLVADKYVENDFPRGWILPNDGYGCGYTALKYTVDELAKRGFHTGLWTENGVEKIAREVGDSGTRLCKLDVAWVGPGYKFALDGCRAAYTGIENNSNARGFVWSVMGWAGTQRYSTIWSGDQRGNWEYIRFHIPTVIGSGLSGFNAATGDIDGIFGGSDSTYTRDLEWKCFTPVLMSMSGWAKKNKQPFVSGYTDINRKYLKLKMQMTPYMYTLCADAHQQGVPAVRGMVLEFPEDTVTYSTATRYQYMLGPSLLVAPVYKPDATRDSIYLPHGEWYDYWNHQKIAGGKWLRHYDAPLEKLPLFVKAGAILPYYNYMDYDGERKADTLTLDIYPSGNSSFNLYEDDGLTREYRKGAFARTLIQSSAAARTVIINSPKGNYTGKYLNRVYVLKIHTPKAPKSVRLNGKPLAGFAYDAPSGILQIRTAYLPTSVVQKIAY